MTSSWHVVASMGLTMGVPLGFALRGLLLPRRRHGGPGPGGIKLEPTPQPRKPGPVQKPLPACLIPKIYPDAAPATHFSRKTPDPRRLIHNA